MCKTCKVDGCNNKHSAKGYCNKHYLQMMKHGRIIDAEIEEKSNKGCLVEGCENEHLAKGYCSKHYAQIKRCGKILERTIFDENEIIEYDDYAEVILCNKDCEEVARAIIDLDDIEKIKICKWHLGPAGYAYNRGKNIGHMHRLIIDAPDGMVVDHINHNILDNRKENLRICTQKQNMCNQSIRVDNSSGYTGVYHVGKNRWVAQIKANGKTKHIGSYKSLEEAIQARRQAEIDYYGEYRRQE